MSAYEGRLRIEGDPQPPVSVEVDLTDERMRVSSGDVDVADWSLDDIRIEALADGFHVRAEGEEIILEIPEDGRFAIELGLRTAHPALRRKMSALMRDHRD